MLRDRRVLVTGGAGFIGSHLVERFTARNEVVVLDSLDTGAIRNLGAVKGEVRIVKGSIRDPRAVRRAVKGADVVFHLAALVSPAESVADPLRYAEANVMGTLGVLTAAQEAGVQRVVFASTCAIYGRAAGPLREDLPPDPLSPYAVTKLACEHFCQSLPENGGTRAVALRLFNVYGPRQRADSPYASVVARFVRAVAAGQAVTIHGDGRQTRDFVYVGDVAEAFERAATARGAAGGVFNVGSGRETSILDIVELLRKLAGRQVEVRREAPRPGDIARSLADTSRARKVLGFEAQTPLPEGIRRTFDAARNGRTP